MATPRPADLDRRSVACEDLRVRRVLKAPTISVDGITVDTVTAQNVVATTSVTAPVVSATSSLVSNGTLGVGQVNRVEITSYTANGATDVTITPAVIAENWLLVRHRYIMSGVATVAYVLTHRFNDTASSSAFDFDISVRRGSDDISFHGRQYYLGAGTAIQAGSLITHDPAGLAETLTVAAPSAGVVTFTTSTLASGDVVTVSLRASC